MLPHYTYWVTDWHYLPPLPPPALTRCILPHGLLVRRNGVTPRWRRRLPPERTGMAVVRSLVPLHLTYCQTGGSHQFDFRSFRTFRCAVYHAHFAGRTHGGREGWVPGGRRFRLFFSRPLRAHAAFYVLVNKPIVCETSHHLAEDHARARRHARLRAYRMANAVPDFTHARAATRDGLRAHTTFRCRHMYELSPNVAEAYNISVDLCRDSGGIFWHSPNDGIIHACCRARTPSAWAWLTFQPSYLLPLLSPQRLRRHAAHYATAGARLLRAASDLLR